jgi:hypothetical protein
MRGFQAAFDAVRRHKPRKSRTAEGEDALFI